MGQKSEQLGALLNAARAELETAYAQLPEAERTANGTWESWAPKDFLGHLNFWQNNLLGIFASLDQPPPQLEPFEVRNEQNYRHYEARPYAECYADYTSSFEKILERVKTLSDADLGETTFPRLPQGTLEATILGNAYTHTIGHLAELYRKLGDDARAHKIQEDAATNVLAYDPSPRTKGVTLYNLACAYALEGNVARAVELLREAFPARPDLIEFSKQDTDFDRVRERPEFQALYN